MELPNLKLTELSFVAGSNGAPAATPNLGAPTGFKDDAPNLMSVDPEEDSDNVLPNLNDPEVAAPESEKVPPNFSPPTDEFEELVPNLNPEVSDLSVLDGCVLNRLESLDSAVAPGLFA